MYNPNMLINSICFGESSNNTFHLSCGMVTPTLFNIGVITGLRPARETFNPILMRQINHNFTFEHTSFSNYIKYHHDNTEEVSTYADIAFLTLLMSHFIFCSISLQVAKKCIPLATQLHEKKDVCLSKLVLGCLYESSRITSHDLKARSSLEDNFLVSGPI